MSRKEYMNDYWIKNPELVRKHRTYYKEIRAKVFLHYSGLPPKCEKCGTEKNLILVGENKRLHGLQLYLRLIKQKFPNGYRILCRKCNK